MEIKAKRHEEQQRELEEEEENSVRNYPQKVDFFFLPSHFSINLGFFSLNMSIALILLCKEMCLFIKFQNIFCLHQMFAILS